MPVREFPDPSLADPEDDVIAVGGDLHPHSLLLAYRQGIFPWPMPKYPLLWFCPRERAVLFFEDLHVPRSLERARRKLPFRITRNEAFDRVIEACAETPRPGQDGTWITKELLEGYGAFHREGYAHSVEVWENDDLVGGIYGVLVEGVFSAESMFFRKPYASKFALLHLIDWLRSEGLRWIDIQQMTPHMERFGARNLTRAQFLKLLRETRGELL